MLGSGMDRDLTIEQGSGRDEKLNTARLSFRVAHDPLSPLWKRGARGDLVSPQTAEIPLNPPLPKGEQEWETGSAMTVVRKKGVPPPPLPKGGRKGRKWKMNKNEHAEIA
jgi:hypothetical protein